MNTLIRRFFSLLFILISFLSCNRNHLENILTGDKNVIWSTRAIEKNKFVFIGQHLKFLSNGTFRFYLADNDNELGFDNQLNICGKDKVTEREWNFIENDSTFLLGIPEMTFKVISYSKDTIMLTGKGFEGRFIWVKIHPSP